MELKRRNTWINGLLLGVWVLVCAWQVTEHLRVRRETRDALVARAKDISTTLGVILSTQRRVISRDRLEAWLSELVKQGSVKAIELLNQEGDSVANAGAPIDPETKGLLTAGAHWGERNVTLVANVMDLGTNLTWAFGGGTNVPIIISDPSEFFRNTNRVSGVTNRPPPPGPEPGGPPPGPPPGPREGNMGGPPRPAAQFELASNGVALPITNGVASARQRGRPRGRPGFGRPPWMSEEEFKTVTQKQGAHSFLIVMSTESMNATCDDDFWLRSSISLLAGLSVAGLGLAWRNIARSSKLEVRLARAEELNARLKEMNLAAAGLAHETRNPLNIIRGLAQMISKREDASTEVRGKTREIIDEADRVTGQLNEFINYSRPREVRRASVALGAVLGELARALTYDIEEKVIHLEVQKDLPRIEADEPLLRQALFNLLLNSVQAVERGGEIQVTCHKSAADGIVLDIHDNGPGVPPERRTDIFKPYFTTHKNGTGLGLAVVQQIVMAHGWGIQCLSNEPRGALFRISHIRLASVAAS